MTKTPRKPKRVTKTSQLTPDPKNARRRTPRNQKLIRESLEKCGAGRSVLIDEQGQIIAGNGVIEQADLLKMKLRVIDTDGDTIIAVRRSDLTEEQKQRLAIADNKTTDESEFDDDMLRQLFKESPDALDGLFDMNEIAALFPEEKDDGKSGDAGPAAFSVEYRIIIECDSEKHQERLLKRFDKEGMTCRALIS